MLGLAAAGELYFVTGVNASCLGGSGRGHFYETVVRCYRVVSQDGWTCASEDDRVIITRWSFQNGFMEYTADSAFALEAIHLLYIGLLIVCAPMLAVSMCLCAPVFWPCVFFSAVVFLAAAKK